MQTRSVFITGGNKGLGFETARRLKEANYDVYIGARNAALGKAAAEKLGVTFVHIDINDAQSIDRAASDMQSVHGGLDILINNAGITGPRKEVADFTADDATAVFMTNVIGPVHVMHAFLPLLQQSAAAVIVNVSSGLGSFAAVHDQSRIESKVLAPLYCASKSALTMLTVQYARAFPHMRINAADPGYTATDLNDHSGPQTVIEGTDAIVKLAMLHSDGPTGRFFDRHGQLQW